MLQTFSRAGLLPLLVFLVALRASAQDGSSQQTISRDPQDWPMYNHDSLATRWNSREKTLSVSNVWALHEKWRFWTTGDVYATPAVVDNTVYFGDSSGTFYALTSWGQLLWSTKIAGPITASALVSNNTIVFGDQIGYIYGLDRSTGALKWHVHPNPSSICEIWSSASWIEGDIVIGVGSDESLSAKDPHFSGSVVRIDPNTGAIRWQTFVISAAEIQAGSSGAAVWSTPTYDAATGLIYASTGNSFTAPASAGSDAVLALNSDTGAIKWIYQATAGDTGQSDADFGDSAHIYSLGNRRVIGIGQKSGRFYVLDALTGSPVATPLQAVPDCHGGNGLFATAAVAGSTFFAPGQNCSYPYGAVFPPATGELSAIATDGSGVKWDKITPYENAMSGVAVANGVVYYAVVGFLGNLIAADAQTGARLATVFVGWGASGPSISHGQLYLGTGTQFASGVYTPPSLVALGL
jgi:polyvinyl alcohol dehydrogenase (cytochrome)